MSVAHKYGAGMVMTLVEAGVPTHLYVVAGRVLASSRSLAPPERAAYEARLRLGHPPYGSIRPAALQSALAFWYDEDSDDAESIGSTDTWSDEEASEYEED